MTDKVIKEPVCFMCANFFYFPFCRAFPEEIPIAIRLGENNHTEPYPGDHGIQFEPIENP